MKAFTISDYAQWSLVHTDDTDALQKNQIKGPVYKIPEDPRVTRMGVSTALESG
jgi:hypothetical protein